MTGMTESPTALKSSGKEKRRHLTIGLFGVAMTAFIVVQVFYPLLPFYAMGYMLGTCVLHSYVVEDEKDEQMCKNLSASYLQGYKYSRPIPIDGLRDFLSRK